MQETLVIAAAPIAGQPMDTLLPAECVGRIEAAFADVAFERLLMVPEAAALLHMHPKTLQAMARAGTVPCIRIGKYWMFRASSLDEWVRNGLESDHQSRRVSMEAIS